MARIYWAFVLSIGWKLLAAEPFPLSFDQLSVSIKAEERDLQAFDHQLVRIKGFLYRREDKESLILASQPNLKSCCIGTSSKANEQIWIKNNLGPIAQQQAVTLEGIFKIKPCYNERGDLLQLYTLECAQLAAQDVPSFPWVTIMLGGLMAALVFFFLKVGPWHSSEAN